MSETIQVDAGTVGDLCFGGEEDDWRWEATVEGDDRRWSRTNTLVLRRLSDNSLWAIEYEEGLTEYQDSDYPWRPEYRKPPETVELYRVYPHTVPTTVYRKTPQ